VATGDIKWRFGSKGYGSPKKQKPPVMPVIQALSTSPTNRDVRVHDVLGIPGTAGQDCIRVLKYGPNGGKYIAHNLIEFPDGYGGKIRMSKADYLNCLKK
jgi:hypothetical protein